MSNLKKRKQEKIQQEEDEVTKPEKKQKSKKKKKEQVAIESQKNKQVKSVSTKQQRHQSQQLNIPKQDIKRPVHDPIAQELSSLQYDGLLTPCQRTCQIINSHLQQVTINLYESMIMRASLINKAISEARSSGLTPKEYFAIDYTNKLLLIQKLLLSSGGNKFGKYVGMIDGEVARVEGLILRSLEEVRTYEEVLIDLKRSNVQWEVKE